MVYILTNFQGDIRNGRLVTANLDGTDRKIIWEGPLTQDAAGPAWSPRGDAILVGVGGFFQRAQIRSAQLMSVDPNNGHASQITHDDANDGMPSWSPDGQQIVYRVARGSNRELHILDLATGTNRKLETGSDYDTFSLVVSPRRLDRLHEQARWRLRDLSHPARRDRTPAPDASSRK